MTEKYPFELSPGSRLIIINNELTSVIKDLNKLLAPEAKTPEEIADDLVVARTFTKQALESLRLARVTFNEVIHNRIMNIETELND